MDTWVIGKCTEARAEGCQQIDVAALPFAVQASAEQAKPRALSGQGADGVDDGADLVGGKAHGGMLCAGGAQGGHRQTVVAQFSNARPAGTKLKARSRVTSTAPAAFACAAIIKSMGASVTPAASQLARKSP
jgi:hypothetical protein